MTPALLRQIEAGEGYLKTAGFPIVRLRVHPEAMGPLARIEIPVGQFPALLEKKAEITTFLRDLGFAEVTLDLEGFRSGCYDRNLKPSNF